MKHIARERNEKMDLQEIQDKLNTLLAGTERKIVFWYDDDAAYAEDINNIQLLDDNKIWQLNDHNWFETKLLLEEKDTTSNYLVYAPFARPDDKENSLVDIFYYSEHFYTDKLVQLMGDLSIPIKCQDEMKKYKKFWSAGNTTKFQNLQITDYTPEKLSLGVMCVLAGIKTVNFEELMKRVVVSGLDDNSILKKFVTNKIEAEFWKQCEKQYGYMDTSPSLSKFMVTMIVTYTDTLTEGNIPKEWKVFLSGKHNDVVVFIKNLMNNEESKPIYDDIADRIARELNASNLIKRIPLENVAACDSFELFDQNIIDWIIAKIEDNMLDEKLAGMTIPEICEARIKTCYHFADKYRIHYLMLFNAYKLIKEVFLHSYKSQLKDVVDDYVQNTYMIDTYYRKFYYYMDKVGMSENVEKIKELVENIYTNKYLTTFAYQWNQTLSDEVYNTYPDMRQEDFYSTYVKPFMKEEGREGRVIVIISDGMRYECARELLDNLDLDEKCDAKINHMLSVLPSETTLGMASLLPHKEIVVDENLDIIVDGMHCGNSTTERQKILQNTIERSACYDFDKVMNAKKDEIREMLQDKDVVYIYQNQIDDRGESSRSENEVFNACQEAIEEIHVLIRRITGYVSATRYLITADHGFIYKRDKLQECDKISMDKSQVSYVNKRYLLSLEPINNEAVISRTLAYLSKLNQIYVSTPLGADIIKAKGGGQNYVHGGSSLQEMVVPVIKVKTFTGKQDTGMVNVELSSFTNKVTSIEVKLDFMQMEPVSDTKKSRRLVAFFVDADGNKISYDVPLIATVREADARKRVMSEKFTLKSGRYSRSKDYFLVLADMDDERLEHHRYKFEIDIAEYN